MLRIERFQGKIDSAFDFLKQALVLLSDKTKSPTEVGLF